MKCVEIEENEEGEIGRVTGKLAEYLFQNSTYTNDV